MNILFIKQVQKISAKVRIVFFFVLLAFLINMTLPQAVQAKPGLFLAIQKQEAVIAAAKPADLLTKKFIEYEREKIKQSTEKKPVKTYTVVATAYSSDVAQTDSTPCITANGFNVCDHGQEDVIAANFLPFGAQVKIPEIYGDKIFTVHDRMNARYNYRIDLWKTSRNRAITFGKRLVKIEVVEM